MPAQGAAEFRHIFAARRDEPLAKKAAKHITTVDNAVTPA
jgi:hypothetical protein